ncbi:SPO22_1 [Sanghuangporus weigelae]
MSTNKRKAAANSSHLSGTFETILGILARVKPKLANQKDGRSTLLEDLQRLAALGETFSEQRTRSKMGADMADVLDREGVHLWNISRLIRQGTGSNEERCLFAAFRLSGFRLIEAGIEQKPSMETLINVLGLASKVGTALSESGKNDIAASVLSSAAKFEEQLRNSEDDGDGTHEQAKARAVVLYYCSRMLAAWQEGNDAIAEFMLEKITEGDERRLSLVPIPDREHIAARIMVIGKSILKTSTRTSEDGAAALGDAKKAQNSVVWLRRAFTLVEKMEDSESPGITDLKRTILRSLVRAYYLSSSIDPENLVRAETTLQELIASIDNSTDRTNPEHRQLRWMWLAVLKKRMAPEPALSEAFGSIVDHTGFTETETTEILQELRTVTQQHTLVSDVLHRCILRALDDPKDSSENVSRFFLALLAHCVRDQDNSRAIKDIETGCSFLVRSEFELAKTPAMACLTILWKVADRHFQMKKWSQAAEWFLICTHKAFASIGHITGPKCLRKAALCYIEQREYARASQIIQQCPSDQSSTFYLQFLTAVYQGFEEDAVAAIQSMASAPDFDRKMLLLATQLSHESDLKIAILASLEALLKTLHTHGPMESDVEAICLARCIVRLVIRLIKEAVVASDRSSLISSLVRHFRTASALVNTAVTGRNAPLIAKDVSWLWRTAYNIALQGCSEWRDAEIQIGELFELSYELAHAYSRIAVANTEMDAYICMAHSAFSSLSARIFSLRFSTADSGDKIRQQSLVIKSIETAKETIASAKERVKNQLDIQNLDELLHSVQVFDAEILCQRQEWDMLLRVINGIGSGADTLASYEAIADMLWSERDCPVNVLYITLESLLRACLDHENLSVEKFSRWLRAICSILLSRNSSSDRGKAISYVEQALVVLENQDSTEPEEQFYPMDERYWLLSTSYNTGIECLASTDLDEAKRWFEAAAVVCRSVPDGARHSERISETYRRLLDQYAPRAS